MEILAPFIPLLVIFCVVALIVYANKNLTVPTIVNWIAGIVVILALVIYLLRLVG